jgi:hypothetical protein
MPNAPIADRWVYIIESLKDALSEDYSEEEAHNVLNIIQANIYNKCDSGELSQPDDEFLDSLRAATKKATVNIIEWIDENLNQEDDCDEYVIVLEKMLRKLHLEKMEGGGRRRRRATRRRRARRRATRRRHSSK